MIRYPDRLITRPRRAGNGTAILDSLGPCLKYYSIISQEKDRKRFFIFVICGYIHEVKAPSSCELCERSCFALTAHHLTPHAVRDTALNEGWRKKETLDNTAWLCRGCHDHVHRIASPLALGKHYWSIELLLKRTEIWQFAKTVGRLVKEDKSLGDGSVR